MSTDVPLLSDYKKSFVRNRLLQTFLGGPKLTGCPSSVALTQIVLFVLPLGLFLPVSLFIQDNLIAIATVAGSIGILTLLYQAISFVIYKDSNVITDVADLQINEEARRRINLRRRQQILNDEEHVDFNGFFTKETWKFIIGKKRHKVNVLVHAAVAAVTAASGLNFLRKDAINELFESDVEVHVVIIFGWIAVTNALYGIMINTPPETATYRALDQWDLAAMSRPIHVILMTLPQIVIDLIEVYGPFAGVYDKFWYGKEPWLWASRLTHVILVFSPILWLLGIFPPLEALILWIGEQVQIFAMGGTATYNWLRFSFHLLLSMIQVVILCAIPNLSLNYLVSIASISGYLLSLDMICVLKKSFRVVRSCFFPAEANIKLSSSRDNKRQKQLSKKKTTLNKLSEMVSPVRALFSHSVFFIVNAAIVVLVPYPDEIDFSQQLTNASSNSTGDFAPIFHRDRSFALTIMGWTTLGIYIATKMTNELQKVYMCFDLLRNPLYHNPKPFGLGQNLWQNFRPLILNFCAGIFLTMYAKWLIMEDVVLALDPMPKWFEVLAIVRLMRWIWQTPTNAMIEMSFLHLILVTGLGKKLAKDFLVFHFFVDQASVPIQLLILAIARDRMMEKLFFAITLSVSSLENRSSRRSYAGCLFQTNILFSPVILFFIFTSSIVSAPMLALFTMPMFFIAYPRPLKFWPGPTGVKTSSHEDAKYYEQLVPSMITSLHQAYRCGSLGIQQVGMHYLGRHDDRIIWIQVMEQGNNYSCYLARGMELQETSCHSLEATRLDDILEDTFEKKSRVNSYPLHTVTPLVSVPVMMYSDSRSSLAGIMENNATLIIIAQTYIKSFSWYLAKHLSTLEDESERVKREMEVVKVNTEEPGNDVLVLKDLPKSESIEAVELDVWPSSESSNEYEGNKWANKAKDHVIDDKEIKSRRSSAYQKFYRSDSVPSVLDNLSDILDEPDRTSRRGTSFLPPIFPNSKNMNYISKSQHDRRQSEESISHRMDSIFLPGGVNEVASPEPPRKNVMELESGDEFHMNEEQEVSPLHVYIKTVPSSHQFNLGDFEAFFSQDWVEKCLKKHRIQGDPQNIIDEFKIIVQGCFLAIYGDFSALNEGNYGPNLPINVFGDVLPTNPFSKWLKNHPALHQSAHLPGFRSAFKVALDQIVIGELDSLDEWEEALEDIDDNWHIGPENSPEWHDAVLNEVPNLFSVAKFDSMEQNRLGQGEQVSRGFRSHVLTMKECHVGICKLNPEVVKGLWASLNLELLYLTNDDDERYSIQAEERIMRNLTVQVADPPLGYSIHSSEVIRKGINDDG